MRPYACLMSLQKLLAMLIAFSVLFAPTVANAQMTFAAADRDMPTMKGNHCQAAAAGDEQKSSPNHHKSNDKSCCAAMCMGVAVTASTPIESRLAFSDAAIFPAPRFQIGLPAEIATPPPRVA